VLLLSRTPAASSTPFVVQDCTVDPARGCIQQGWFRSALEGEQTYWVYVPPGYPQPERRYPVLYMFHGSNSPDGRQWINVGLTEAADAGIANGTLPQFIIVMPASPLRGLYMFSGGGGSSYEATIVSDLIAHVDQTFASIPTREGRAIGGLSRGAYWSLEVAFRHPELFRTVGAHSAALSVATAPPGYHPYELAASPAIRELRIYLDTGENDYLREGPERLHALLDANGVAHTYVLNPGAHEEAYWAAHAAEYLAFYAAEW
jgi:enterochelin esterase-like enzyme